MTRALCFNCGDIKFGAICPCPKCGVGSSGDVNLDIAFSDHRISKTSLEQLGKVIGYIRERTADDELRFWAFIRYVAIHHTSVLDVTLEPELESRCDELLARGSLPDVRIAPPAKP
jgi:hypothetical protein